MDNLYFVERLRMINVHWWIMCNIMLIMSNCILCYAVIVTFSESNFTLCSYSIYLLYTILFFLALLLFFFFYPVCQDWLACTFCSSLCLCGIKSHPEHLTPDLDVLTPLFYSWGSIRFKRTTGLANKGPVGGDGPHIKHAPQAEEWVNVRGESVPG